MILAPCFLKKELILEAIKNLQVFKKRKVSALTKILEVQLVKKIQSLIMVTLKLVNTVSSIKRYHLGKRHRLTNYRQVVKSLINMRNRKSKTSKKTLQHLILFLQKFSNHKDLNKITIERP